MAPTDGPQGFHPDGIHFQHDQIEFEPSFSGNGVTGKEAFGTASCAQEIVQGLTPICLVFAAGETAAHWVLAVPALARALREVQLAGWAQCSVCIPAGWRPGPSIAAEITRLAPNLQIEYCEEVPSSEVELIVQGEKLLSHHDLAAAARAFSRPHGDAQWPQNCCADAAPLELAEAYALLSRRTRQLLAATSKPGDGVIARLLNRPVSQAATRMLLGWFGPIHPNTATVGTAIIGAGMVTCLIQFPGRSGLLLGALLFQLASIFDGIDGEIARATFRATPLGASIDSLVDAATNLLFFAGVVANLYIHGDHTDAAISLGALGGLTFGIALLGLIARRQREGIDFNSVKHLVAGRGMGLMQALTWLTMRDFYAFAALMLIGFGLIETAVWAFAIIVSGWLAVVLVTLALSAGRSQLAMQPSSLVSGDGQFLGR